MVVIDKPDAVQTQIRVGQAALAYTDPDFFTAAVYDTVLGGGSTGRLFREIRIKRGLAYGAYCRFAEQLTGGSFAAATSTKTASTVEALRLTLEVIAGMARSPVPAVELDEAKTYLNGAFPLEIETPTRSPPACSPRSAIGLGREFLDSYRERIGAVTAADVQRFAGTRIHPERMRGRAGRQGRGLRPRARQAAGARRDHPRRRARPAGPRPEAPGRDGVAVTATCSRTARRRRSRRLIADLRHRPAG